MKTIAIVGIGTIIKHYLDGLNKSSVFNLCAVSDILENPASLEYISKVPFYRDYKEMIEKAKPDYIMISTPPKTHFDIAKYALKNNINVIVEKPAVLKMEEYDKLTDLAKQKNLDFEVAFHWQNGSEIKCFNKLYNPKCISEISVSVSDPYSSDGVYIDEDKLELMGAWIDSGVNILSMIKMWLPFEKVSVNTLEIQRCKKTQLPIFIDLSLNIDGIPTHIVIDWRKHIDNKSTEVVYDGRKIIINNSLQQIEDGKKIVNCYEMARLTQHYYNFFVNYQGKQDKNSAREIHRVLLGVAEQYDKDVS